MICKMEDLSEKMAGKTPKELLKLGARAYACTLYHQAVQYLSRASELTVQQEGTQTHDSLGEIYFLYGKSLLELSREEGDPLGDVVPKDVAVAQEAEEDSDAKNNASGDSENGSEEESGDEEGEEGEEEEEEGGEEEEDEDEEGGEGDEKVEGAEKKDDEKKEETAAKGVEINGVTDENAKNEAQEKESEKKKADEEGDDKKDAEAGSSDPNKSQEEDEVASDLQVAWEVLELAKIIFQKRGEEAKSDLAETLIALGEISMESENFENAVNDIREGLEMQKVLCDDTDRTLAETHYKLGMALSMNNKIDEAVENFNRCIQLLKNRIDKLKESQRIIEQKEVEEMKQLIPEIEEKIVDLKNYTEEVVKKSTEDPRPILPGSPEKKASDISHLVKRKRKSEEGEGSSPQPAKKPALKLD